MAVVKLHEEYNKYFNSSGNIRYFNASQIAALEEVLQHLLDTLEPGSLIDIGNCRVNIDASIALTHFMCNEEAHEKNIKICDTQRPFMQVVLDQNYARNDVLLDMATVDFPTLTKRPENVAAIRAEIDKLDANVVYKFESPYKLDSNKGRVHLYFLILTMLHRPEIRVVTALHTRKLFETVHELYELVDKAHNDDKTNYDSVRKGCYADWIIVHKLGIFEIHLDADRTYDMGPEGRLDFKTIYAKYSAVPSVFGNERLLSKWKVASQFCTRQIYMAMPAIHDDSLYKVIHSDDE